MRSLLFLALTLFLISPFEVNGQTPSLDTRRGAQIALIDVNRVVRNFKAYKDHEKSIQASVDAAKKHLAELEAEYSVLDKKRLELLKGLESNTAGSPKRKVAEEALAKKTAETQMKIEQISQYRQIQSAGLTNDLRSQAIQAANTVIDFVNTYAAEKGFTVVINVPTPNDKEPEARVSSDVIVGLPKLREQAKDITDDIIQALEKR